MALHVARLALIGLVALFTAHTCQKSSNDFDDASRSAIRVVQRSSLDGNSAKKRENKLDKVLSLVQNLYSQVNTLEQRMKDIEKQQAEIDLSVICSNRQADYENGYDITNCGNKTSDQEDYFLVDATFGTWKEHGFCRVFQTKKLHKKCYVVTAHMFNVMTEKDVNHGYIGLAYNIKNNENFDFVILRLHRKNSCYQTGYMENGKLRLTEFNGNCPDGPPNGHTWFKMQVFVRDNEAQLYLNDKPVVSFTSHLSPIGRGGVIVAAGVNSVIRIRGLDVAAVEPFFFSFYNCKSHQMIRDQFYILSAPFGTFPDSGFCRAISKQRISGTNYIITARMFNENLYPGSKVGLMFNAQDPYNFDFVNFQVDSVGGCYETGFVQNSRINYISTKKGPCPSGPFKTATWHNVTVYVKGDQVSILLDGERIISTKGHFPTRAVGGVVVSSGTDNSASFKDFKLSPTAPNAFELEGCSPHSRLAPNYHVLDAKHGKWSLDGFCRAISRKTVSESNYIVSTELFIHVKHLARDKKIFVGLAFNSKDTSNFDFVYVRPHTHGYCYRLGFVMNGVVQFPIWQEGKCPGRRPKTGKWFKISVAIFESMAVVKLNGIHLVTYESHYRGVSKGGVIVSNGGDNELTFRNFKLNSIKPLKFKFSHCGKRTHKNNGHYTMDGTLGHWPRDGFCTALPHYTADVSFMEYSVLVKLKIVECMVVIDSRNAGLMFNAVDENNYEYVYISIHNKESCFQFGSVVGGEIKEKKQNSGPCVGKIPKQGDWFSLRVHVSHDSRATFYVDNIATGKFASSSIWHPYGGILVPHGYRNIVMFREFLTFPRFR